MKKMIVSLAAALILMGWSFLFWVVVPIPTSTTLAIPHEESVVTKLQETLPESGVYFYPSLPEKISEEGFSQKFQKGPLIQIFYHKEGHSPFSLRSIVLGFVHFWFCSLVIIGIFQITSAYLFSYQKRMLLMGCIGLFASVATHGFYPIWFYQDFIYHASQMLFECGGWMVAGLVLVRFSKPSTLFSPSLGLSHS